jgi:hypothetical protein
VVVVVVVALLAALLSALSAAGEQRVASRLAERLPRRGRSGPGTQARPRSGGVRYLVAFALALVTTPLWLGSWLVDALSYVAHATALHLGSLSVVQPLMVTTLLFTVPLAALGTGRRVAARDWVAVSALCAGLALVLSTREPSAVAAVPGPMLVPALGAVTTATVVLVVLARGRSAPVRAAMLAAAAGGLFSVGAATTKLTADVAVTSGFVGLLTSWSGYALAVVSLASFAMQQAAYASGPLAPAMTAVIVVDPLASYLLGVVGFGESLPASGAPLTLAALGMVVLVVAVAALAHSPLLQPAGRTPEGDMPVRRPPVPARANVPKVVPTGALTPCVACTGR